MPHRLLATGVATALCLAAFVATPAVAAPTESDATFAAIGDLPYSAEAIKRFPALISQINADTSLESVIHVGDTKSGSTPCNDAFYPAMAASLNTFEAPVVYTPGDNEWTDCHREKAGKYQPLTRLRLLRKTHFAKPGWTLGKHPMKVSSQPVIPENVRYRSHGVTFATLHVVGSNNSAVTWTGLGMTAETAEQRLERFDRTQRTIGWIKETFAQARSHKDRAVTFAMQANMFDGTPNDENFSAFRDIVRTIAHESAAFGKPVYLINGDSHSYETDKPLSQETAWTTYYGVKKFAPNLTRVTVEGDANALKSWLKVTIHATGNDVLTWKSVPFTA